MVEEKVYNFEHLSTIYISPALNYCVYTDMKRFLQVCLSCSIKFLHGALLPCGVKIIFTFCESAKPHMLPVTHIPHGTKSLSRESFCPAYSCLSTTVCFLVEKHFPEEAYTFLAGFCFNAKLTSEALGIWHSLVYTVFNTVPVFCLNML